MMVIMFSAQYVAQQAFLCLVSKFIECNITVNKLALSLPQSHQLAGQHLIIALVEKKLSVYLRTADPSLHCYTQCLLLHQRPHRQLYTVQRYTDLF